MVLAIVCGLLIVGLLLIALEVAGTYALRVIAYFLNPWNWQYVGKSPVRDLAQERKEYHEPNPSEEHPS